MVYVHIPFCRSRCLYCGFYSNACQPPEGFIDELCAEALRRRDEIAASSAVNTLYIGGGTPSVLPLADLGRIADACGGRYYREWTVEVNPDDVTPGYARGLRELGVNLVSMGVQSLDDDMLRWMRRRHDADGARRAFRALRDAGFDNISVDIIFGINGLSMGLLRSTLSEILSWQPEHISAYQLSIDDDSALRELNRTGEYCEMDQDDSADQYDCICAALSSAGYDHYEISNWARPGYAAVHNSAYWARQPYVGLGPGGHSLLSDNMDIIASILPRLTQLNTFEGVMYPTAFVPETATVVTKPAWKPRNPAYVPSEFSFHLPAFGLRTWNSKDLSSWTTGGELLTLRELWEEDLMLGLRTAEGIPERLLKDYPPEDEDNYTPGEYIADPLRNYHLLVPSAIPGNLRIPESLWLTADDIISSFLELS